MKQPKTPNLDKMVKVTSESNLIGEFVDWMRNERGLKICEWSKEYEGHYPVYYGYTGINRLIAEYYEIEYDEMDNERRRLLEWIRAQQEIEE